MTLRLGPPADADADARWSVEDTARKRVVRVPPLGVYALLRAMAGATHDEIARGLRDECGATNAEAVIASLESAGLVGDDAASYSWVVETGAKWERHGWREAFHFHLLNYDYRFLDFTAAAGPQAAQARMEDYYASEPELPRHKRYVDSLSWRPLPRPDESSVPEPLRLPAATSRTVSDEPLLSRLSRLLALAIGKIGERPLPQPEANPVMLRTSPSGGSRHPTEAYLVAIEVAGLAPGWYHCTTREPGLDLIRAGLDEAELHRFFIGAVGRAPFRPAAIIVLTTLFERNMFRYREPRTFRSVHLDAGHLAGTLEALAASVGLESFAHFGADDVAIEEHLGLDGLHEGVVLTLALSRIEPGDSHATPAK
jgi:SagB-type dehydrogenase family enzyme